MMRAARDAADEEAARLSRPAPPIIVAVTVLTSLDDAALAETGVASSAAAQVERLAVLAQDARLDGVVASPREIATHSRDVRTFVHHRHARNPRSGVTRRAISSGRRPPAEALAAGASYLVIGRPITSAANPREAAERIAADCRGSHVG